MKSMKGAVVLGCLLAGTTLPALGVTINAGTETPLWDIINTYTSDNDWDSAKVNTTANQVLVASYPLMPGVDTQTTLIIEFAGYASGNTFGIYNPTTMATQELFPGSAGSGATKEVVLPSGWTEFGFYFGVTAEGKTYYSAIGDNYDGKDHMVGFRGDDGKTITIDSITDTWESSDLILGLEDKSAGSDWDFNDMVVFVDFDEKPAPPAPDGGSTAALLGGAMLVLGGYRRMRR